MRIGSYAYDARLFNPFGLGKAAPAEDFRNSFGPSVVREHAVPNAPKAEDGGFSCAAYGPNGMATEEQATERRTLADLERRDEAVRRRDGEHAASNGLEDPSRFIYQTGPDGKRYAIGAKPRAVEREADPAERPAGPEKDVSGEKLSAEDRELLDRLKARNAKVRAHEHAHMAAAAGQAVGPPSYDYQTGPDGKRYAVGGSVDISMSYNSGDPEASLRSARTAQAAAMATGEPSGQDMATAARASAMAARAMRDGLEKYAAQAL